MESSTRWIISLLVVVAIVALVAFARGGEERGNPDASPQAVISHTVA